MTARRVLQVVHDFLPRHRAGVEIYVASLARELARRHHVTILTTEYDPRRRHGDLAWRVYDGVPVVEVVNNWEHRSFEDTYRSPSVGRALVSVLDAVQPQVVHVHSLLNLSFELPAEARRRGIPVVATLHDYTPVCASGGQRVHQSEQHVCHTIDTVRCARCFPDTVFHTMLSVGRLSGRGSRGVLTRAGAALHARAPAVARALATQATTVAGVPVTVEDMDRRLAMSREVMKDVDLFVAPSPSIADEYRALGVPAGRLCVSDYGFDIFPVPPRPLDTRPSPLRIGYVGSLVWHKGVHVLIDAVRSLATDEVRLVIFGDPAVSPDYAADLRRRADGLPVAFRGPFGAGERPEVYRSFDVLAVPSLWLENSPLVIHEAFIAGLPAVGSNIGGIPGLIVHDVNGLLVAPGAAEALGAALRRLATEPGLLARLASHRTPVKTIADDAAEWEQRYASVCG